MPNLHAVAFGWLVMREMENANFQVTHMHQKKDARNVFDSTYHKEISDCFSCILYQCSAVN